MREQNARRCNETGTVPPLDRARPRKYPKISFGAIPPVA
jgi:hypothetical protein